MDIEIVVNKEINAYKESIFFGLSLRQFICSIAAVAAAVILYLLLIGKLGRQITSWLCIIGAAPLAVAGFFKYNGLNLERFIWAVVKTNWLLAGRRLYRAENYSYRFMQSVQNTLEQKGSLSSSRKGKFTEGKRFRYAFAALATRLAFPISRFASSIGQFMALTKGKFFLPKPKKVIAMKEANVPRKRND